MRRDSDPTPLTDAVSETPPRLRRLLERAQKDGGTADDEARVRARLGALLISVAPATAPTTAAPAAPTTAAPAAPTTAAPAAPATAPPAAPATNPPPAPHAILSHALPLGLATAGIVAVAGVLFFRSPSPPAPQAPARAPAVAPAPAPPAPVPSQAPVPEAAPQPAPQVQAPPRPAPAPARPAATEDELLDRAQQAIGHNPRQALALTEQQARRFPRGQFIQEREVIAIDALVRLGRVAEANARGQAFTARWPDSAHTRRVRDLLQQRH